MVDLIRRLFRKKELDPRSPIIWNKEKIGQRTLIEVLDTAIKLDLLRDVDKLNWFVYPLCDHIRICYSVLNVRLLVGHDLEWIDCTHRSGPWNEETRRILRELDIKNQDLLAEKKKREEDLLERICEKIKKIRS